MTREEITRLLEALIAAYPSAKIVDARGMVNAWEMAFGDECAETIYKAARLHMKTNKFFPTIADISKCIPLSGIYGQPEKRLPVSTESVSGCTVCVYEDDCDKIKCLFEGRTSI